ncbi:MAG: glyoxalase/bleomycin resistance/dioxygenase family protein, partial [Acidimicrobiia bacterium]
CYALQDKVWVSDPDGAPWEIYTVLADGDTMGRSAVGDDADVCCAGSTTNRSAEEGSEPTPTPAGIGCC